MTVDLAGETVSRSAALRIDFGRSAATVALAAAVAGIAAANGGYFPRSWGWSALALGWGAALALALRRRIAVGLPEVALVVLTVLLLAWIAASIAWSKSEASAVNEVERALVYALGVVLVVVAGGDRVRTVLAGACGGIAVICAYALATRLFPDSVGTFDSIGGYRLSEPLGYWNALGLFAGMGALLALGFTARAHRIAGRALAAAALPVLAATMYVTFSRGAWAALVVGAAVMVALDPRRLQLLAAAAAVLPGPAVAVWLASRADALTSPGAPLAEASSQGHRLAATVAALAAGSAAAALLFAVLERRVRVRRPLRVAFGGALAAIAAAVLVAVFARYGGPGTLAERAYEGFKKPPVRVESGESLGKRLFDLSSNRRVELWQAAWADYRAHPWLGSGAGSYEQYWYRNRPSGKNVRDAHSLYVETLAELGPIGLGLLAGVLAVPLAGARARRSPLVPAALGAYAAYLVHASYDWDWEMPALTLTALACGLAALVYARDGRRVWRLSRRVRAAIVAVLLVPTGFAFVALVGNSAAGTSRDALGRQDWGKAESQARKAASWAPWSPEPWRLLARARLGRGDRSGAVHAYRKAISKSPGDYRLWVELSYVAEGRERQRAVRRTLELNPRISGFPRSAG